MMRLLFIQRTLTLSPTRRYLLSPLLFLGGLICFILNQSGTVTGQTNDRWILVGEDAARVRFFVERESLKPIRPNSSDKKISLDRKVWTKLLYADYSYQINLNYWRCQERRFMIAKALFYRDSGQLIRSFNVREKWIDITPDTSAEAIHRLVCQQAEKTDTPIGDTAKNLPKKAAQVLSSQVKVKTEQANIRKSPSINSEVITRVRLGEIFSLTAAAPSDGWYQINLPSASALEEIFSGPTPRTGWIHGNTIEFIRNTNQLNRNKQR